ncbi:MAG: MFS transporter, partial [Sulfolobaceae archaeon]|nr:MFS transporter [Sulfolobaceae archaeon]
IQAFIFFMIGWWFRNFRSPIRRAMMTEVTEPEERSEAFGILHSLDIAGALLAITYLSVLLFLGYSPFKILLFTSIPLVVSTVLLGLSRAGSNRHERVKSGEKLGGRVFWTVVFSTMFFGFSYYSFGFPILTVAQLTGKDYMGIIAYGIFLGSSSLLGYIFGKTRIAEAKGLAFLGYFLASMASLGFGLLGNYGIISFYPLSFLLGSSVAATEVFEPTIVSKVVRAERMGQGMGMLSVGRSIGILIGNVVMGFLYQLSYSYAYFFASAMSFIAFLLVLVIVIIEKD